MEKEDLRTLFLESFVGSILFSISPPIEVKSEITNVVKEEYSPSIYNESTVGGMETIGPMHDNKMYPRVENVSVRGGMLPSLPLHGESFPYTRRATPMRIQPIATPSPMAARLPLGRLMMFLSDPSVVGIECPGPGKNVLVYKFGAINTTSIVLSQEEIAEIMKTVSERTRIPLINGVFKAALDNIIVTAVISEFAGTRFHIDKMQRASPHQFGFR